MTPHRAEETRRPGRLAALALFALALAGGAGAQAPGASPAPDDPEAVVVQDLVVTARAPGPALWRVSKGAAEVYLIGLPAGPIPKGFDFDRARIQARLAGADYLPPPQGLLGINVGLGRALGLLVRMAPGMGWTNGDPLKSMPPDLAARFEAVRVAIGAPRDRYASPLPALAALKLQKDVLEHVGLTGDAGKAIEADARKFAVRVLPPIRVAAPSLTPEQLEITQPPVADCLSAILSEAETDPARYRAAAEGWASGRLAAALSAPREALSYCEIRFFSGAVFRKAALAEADFIANRLSKPGKLVAAMSLRTLLAPNGLIEQLKARGFEVTGPASPDAG